MPQIKTRTGSSHETTKTKTCIFAPALFYDLQHVDNFTTISLCPFSVCLSVSLSLSLSFPFMFPRLFSLFLLLCFFLFCCCFCIDIFSTVQTKTERSGRNSELSQLFGNATQQPMLASRWVELCNSSFSSSMSEPGRSQLRRGLGQGKQSHNFPNYVIKVIDS